MVRKKVRARSLLLKKKTHCNEKVRRTQFYLKKKPNKQIYKQINKQTNKQTNQNGKAKGKNSILTFQKNHLVRKNVRTVFLLFQKHLSVMKKVRARSLPLKEITL